MKTREVSVIGRTVYGNGEVELIRTSVGIDQMHVLFDSAEWVAFGAVSVTFKNSADTENPITTSITPTAIDSPDWSAEATCLIPWEVIQDIGDIAVTFQATDSSSNHIITARAESVLSVIEAGDVDEGTVPSTAPTLSEWEQAYADTMEAASSAADAAAQVEAILNSTTATTMEELLDELGSAIRYKGEVESVEDLKDIDSPSVGDAYSVDNACYIWDGEEWKTFFDISGGSTYTLPIASASTLGGVKVGTGLAIDANGVLSIDIANGDGVSY